MTQNELIDELTAIVRHGVERVSNLKNSEWNTLNYRPSDVKWNALQCLEHLNLYGDFYLPEIESSIVRASKNGQEKNFSSGLLGNYFAKSMMPKNGNVTNKMKTFKDKNPNQSLSISVLDRFLKQQKQLLQLLDASRKVDLNRVKTAISISKLVKLKLGDTFRFVINHQVRHLLQMEQVISQVNSRGGEASK